MRRRLSKSLVLLAAVMATGFLAAGCGKSGVSGAIASLTPSKSISLPTRSASDRPNSSDTPTPTPTLTTTPIATPTPTPTLTVTETPSATTAAPTPTSSPASTSGSNSSLIWLWVAIGALVLIGIMVLVVRSSRRSDTKASWQARASDAYSRGAAVHDAMSIAERRGAQAEDAGPRWYDIQRRADDLAQMLYALRESAPDEDSRDRVADLITSLQATRSAMDAERAPGGGGPLQAEDVRRRPVLLEAALGALRPPDYGPR